MTSRFWTTPTGWFVFYPFAMLACLSVFFWLVLLGGLFLLVPSLPWMLPTGLSYAVGLLLASVITQRAYRPTWRMLLSILLVTVVGQVLIAAAIVNIVIKPL